MSITDPDSFTPLRKVIPLKTRDLAKKVLLMSEVLCNRTLYNYQRDFALAILEAVFRRTGDEPTALYSRQSGKTEVVGVVAVGGAVFIPALGEEFPDDERVSLFAEGFRVGCYGPKQDKAQLAYDRIRSFAESSIAETIYSDPMVDCELIKSRGDSCAWSNGSYVLAQTASEHVDNEGQTWHLLICDESQKMGTLKFRKELSPMLASTNGPMVMIGTASGSKGYFFRSIEDNIQTERETGRRLHFEYNYEAVVAERRAKYETEVERFRKFAAASPEKQIEMLATDPFANRRPNPFHLNYEKSVEKELRKIRYDKEDDSFKMNYRLLWPDNRQIAIPADLWRSRALPGLELNIPRRQGILCAGLDLAKGTKDTEGGTKADSTVLSVWLLDLSRPVVDKDKTPGKETKVFYPKILIGLYQFQGRFEKSQIPGIREVLETNYPGLKMLLVDSTGVGDPITERLQDLMSWTMVEGYSFSSASKSNMYKNYLMEINHELIFYGAGPMTKQMLEFEKMNEQHEGLQRWSDAAGYLHCEAEDGEHDDYPDSCALGVLACKIYLEQHHNNLQQVEMEIFSTTSPSSAYNSGRRSQRTRAERYKTARRGRRRR